MNRTPFVFCAFCLVATFALAGCGGGGSATESAMAATVTKTADTTVVSTDTVAASPSPTESPLPGALPCADDGESRPHTHPGDDAASEGRPGGGRPADDGRPGDGNRPVCGAVKSVDAATLSFVLAAPPKRGGATAPKPTGGDGRPKPAELLVVTDTATVFVKRSSRETGETAATFADLSTETKVMVKGTLDKTTKTLTATRVEIVP